jgi:hypothetical protein
MVAFGLFLMLIRGQEDAATYFLFLALAMSGIVRVSHYYSLCGDRKPKSAE